ncbi:MAG: flagellin FliC [bacterium]|nr:flagellin FliC [bacterium]
MSLTLRDSSLSLGIQRQLALHTRAAQRSMQRLSSGRRITRAADDPAGLAIGLRLAARVRSTVRAQRNALDGVSLLQVGEGALNEVSDMLVRIRELAIQAASGTLSDRERSLLQQEADGLIQEIDRIANVTEFNGASLLDGSNGGIVLQVGASVGDVLSLSPVDARSSQLGGGALAALDLSSQTGAQNALAVADLAIGEVTRHRASFGTQQVRLEHRIRSLGVQAENESAARSRIFDVDFALETAELTRSQILQQVGISLLAQANIQQQAALQLLQATLGR